MYLAMYFFLAIAAATVMLTLIVRRWFKQYKSRREQVDWRWEWEK